MGGKKRGKGHLALAEAQLESRLLSPCFVACSCPIFFETSVFQTRHNQNESGQPDSISIYFCQDWFADLANNKSNRVLIAPRALIGITQFCVWLNEWFMKFQEHKVGPVPGSPPCHLSWTDVQPEIFIFFNYYLRSICTYMSEAGDEKERKEEDQVNSYHLWGMRKWLHGQSIYHTSANWPGTELVSVGCWRLAGWPEVFFPPSLACCLTSLK